VTTIPLSLNNHVIEAEKIREAFPPEAIYRFGYHNIWLHYLVEVLDVLREYLQDKSLASGHTP
jgi:hypothetical protein